MLIEFLVLKLVVNCAPIKIKLVVGRQSYINCRKNIGNIITFMSDEQ